MIVAERISQVLVSLGVRRAYGLPGEDHMPLLAAFTAAGVEYHTACNESSAVIMAATDYQVSGAMGVAVLSMATGVSNGVNGVLHAFMEGVPVLVLSGRWSVSHEPVVVRQGLNPEPIIRPVTKWTSSFLSDADPAPILCKAIDIASTPRPGPVYLELPDEVAVADCGPTDDAMVAVLHRRVQGLRDSYRVGPPLAEPQAAQLSQRLLEARRPTMIVGGRSPAVSRDVLSLFAESYRTPVFTTPGQKGLLTSECEYFAGSFLNGNLEKRILGESDLVLAINPEAYDYFNRGWPHPEATVVVSQGPLNEWLFAFGDRIVAHPDGVLRELVRCAPSDPRSLWQPSDILAYRKGLRDSLLGTPGGRMTVAQAIDTALQAIPAGSWVLADAGFSKPLVALLSETSERGKFLASNALSTMGFGIPGAVGASLAGAAPVIAFMGDGSLLMRASELIVARNASTPPICVAIMDRSLSQIRIKQGRRGLAEIGVALPELSCSRIGEAFGIRGVDVHDLDSLRVAVGEAFLSGECVLIGAHVDSVESQRVFELIRS